MKVLVAGPMLTSALADATGINLDGLPAATAQTPLAPLVKGLLDAGHTVEVVSLDPAIDRTETFTRGGLTITYCPLRSAPKYKARSRMKDLFAVEIQRICAVMRESDADVVHAHWTYEYAEAALRSGKPNLVTMHDLGWDYLFQFRDAYRFMRLIMKIRTTRRVKNISVVSTFMRPKLWQYGCRARADVVPNPINYSDWYAKDIEFPKIVSVGNSNKIKNIRASVSAFEIIKQVHPRAELHLFGPGLDDRSPLAAASGVIGHGNVTHRELMSFLRDDATVLVHPSLLETFGVAVGEAKMRGVPAIAGWQAKGTIDVIGEAGHLVDVTLPEEIADATLKVLQNREKYHLLQMMSHRDMVNRFCLRSITNSYLAIYQRILKERKVEPRQLTQRLRRFP